VSINLSVFYNDYGPPEAEEIVYAVSVLKASCEVKGLNPFGEVSAGYILLEGPLFPQKIDVTWLNRESRMDCRLCDPDLNSSTYDLWVDCVYPDLPFAECCTSEGKKTVRRLTDGGKDFEPFQGVVQCLGICRREDNLRVVLILGESATVDGAFERLGFLYWTMEGSDNPEELDYIDHSWDRAERKVVKIV
jgi:hypothetical protein